ncbi:MAG TPA: peroxidase-related enzyme [Solirubrobacterales bacterium]|jgi:uncharacterized peroxidase-related enzyme|nr:peroxidase-related enzyme [Solirubrobacterales bacterium]
MPHIDLPAGLPGILGPMAFNPDTARPLNALAEALLRQAGSLSPGERELIAAYTSSRNDCHFCTSSHAAAAAHHLAGDEQLVHEVCADPESAPISAKLKALLAIAAKVQRGGLEVSDEDVARAREQGASDQEIHDAVLIAAAFCMFNRYVDGLATWAPRDQSDYREPGRLLAEEGYVRAGERIAEMAAASRAA